MNITTHVYASHMHRDWWVWTVIDGSGRVLDGDKEPTERLANEAAERAIRRLVEGSPTEELVSVELVTEGAV